EEEGERGTLSKARSIVKGLPRPSGILRALEDELGISHAGLTAQTQPAILAEVMPSAAVVSLTFATSLLFLVGAGLIFGAILQGTTTLDVPWAADDDAATSISASAILGGNVCGGSLNTSATTSGTDTVSATAVVVAAPDPGGGPSASGCTDFSPTGDSLLAFGSPSTSSSSSLTAAVTAGQPQRYGAVFAADFAGLHGLYGSVSLRAAFSDEDNDDGDNDDEEGTATAAVVDSLPETAVVDLLLEACTKGAAGEWGECE
ncbi:unnamed protein product, partial [Scytosiphon promiscuus]